MLNWKAFGLKCVFLLEWCKESWTWSVKLIWFWWFRKRNFVAEAACLPCHISSVLFECVGAVFAEVWKSTLQTQMSSALKGKSSFDSFLVGACQRAKTFPNCSSFWRQHQTLHLLRACVPVCVRVCVREREACQAGCLRMSNFFVNSPGAITGRDSCDLWGIAKERQSFSALKMTSCGCILLSGPSSITALFVPSSTTVSYLLICKH